MPAGNKAKAGAQMATIAMVAGRLSVQLPLREEGVA